MDWDGHIEDPVPSRDAAFRVAASLVVVMLLGVGAISAAAVLGGDEGEAAVAVAPGGRLDLTTVPHDVAEHYMFADRHASVYAQVPCFCGCDRMLGHRHLLDCFVRAGGGWEAHASGCGVCLQESTMIRDLLAEGATPPAIREAIVARYTANG